MPRPAMSNQRRIMDPQSAAHLIRLMRAIAIELHIANDIATNVAYKYSTVIGPETLDEMRDRYREEMA